MERRQGLAARLVLWLSVVALALTLGTASGADRDVRTPTRALAGCYQGTFDGGIAGTWWAHVTTTGQVGIVLILSRQKGIGLTGTVDHDGFLQATNGEAPLMAFVGVIRATGGEQRVVGGFWHSERYGYGAWEGKRVPCVVP